MFTAGRWRQCQLYYFRVRVCVRVWVCVCVCADDSAARPAAVGHSGSSSATQSQTNTRLLFWYFLPIVSKTRAGGGCAWDPVVCSVVFGIARWRSGGAQRTGRRREAAGFSRRGQPARPFLISRWIFWRFVPPGLWSPTPFCSGLTWTHPPRRPAAFIPPSLLSTFPPFYAWCSVLPAGECPRPDVPTQVIKESSLKIQQ